MQRRFYKPQMNHLFSFFVGGTAFGLLIIKLRDLNDSLAIDLVILFSVSLLLIAGAYFLHRLKFETLLLDSYGIKSGLWRRQIPWKVIDEIYVGFDHKSRRVLYVNVRDEAPQLKGSGLTEGLSQRYAQNRGRAELHFAPAVYGLDEYDFLDTIYEYFSNVVSECVKTEGWCGRPEFLEDKSKV